MTSPTPCEIRAARESANLTQTEAAALIGYTLRGWQNWEGGQRKMRASLWQFFLERIPK